MHPDAKRPQAGSRGPPALTIRKLQDAGEPPTVQNL